MPHSRELRSIAHDDHDPILVVALSADDLAGTDRDQALALTGSCADCALLFDDLRALARATASAPPPISVRPRDFQLTPADAARLRPGGLRRLVAAFSDARSGLTRPLGVGLATLGLAGLLIGNVQLSLGGSAATPAAGGAAQDPSQREIVIGAPAAPAASAGSGRTGAEHYLDAASGAPPVVTSAQGGPTASANDNAAAGVPAPEGTNKSTSDGSTPDVAALNSVATGEPFRPLNLLFGGAIVLGLALLVASRLRGRSTI